MDPQGSDSTPSRSALAGGLMAGAATFTIGGSVAITAQLDDYPFLAAQSVRYLLAAAILGAVMAVTSGRWPRPSRRDVLYLCAIALSGQIAFNLLLLLTVGRAEPAVVGVIVGIVPLVLAVAGPLFRGAAPSSRLVVAALAVVAGAAVVQGVGEATPLGLLFAVGILGCEAAFTLLAVPVLPTLGALAVSTYASAIAGGSLAVVAVAAKPSSPWPMPTLPEASAIAYLAVIATAMAFLGWYAGVGRLGVERAGLLAGLIPVAALLSGAALGEGALTWPKVAGVGLVAVGISLGLAPRKRASHPPLPCVELEPYACANGD